MPADTPENTDILATLDDLEDEVGTVTSGPSGIFLPEDYGGDPTGVADSASALQAAITAAAAVKGTVHLGKGTNTWRFGSVVNGASDTRITGASGGMGGGNAKGPVLKFTGTGAGPALNFSNKGRFEIDHCRLVYTDPTWTGPFIEISGDSVDCINWHIHHVQGFEDTTGDFHCKGFIVCARAIIGKISECGFDGGENLIVLGDPSFTGSNYVNNVQVTNCTFNNIFDPTRGQILIGTGDAQAISIDHCCFEAGVDNTALRGSGTADGDGKDNMIYSLTYANNWHGDSSAPTNWVHGLNGHGLFGPVLFLNNFFADNNGGTHIACGENGCSFTILANRFVGGYMVGSTLGGSYTVPMMFSNYTNVSGYWAVGDEPSEGNATMFRQGQNVMLGQAKFRHDNDFDDPLLWENAADLVLGGIVSQANTPLDIQSNTALYQGSIGGGARALIAQSPGDDVDAEVQIVTGTTPTAKVRADGTGVAFNNSAPVAKPTVTGAKAGNAALTSLCSALATLGLITNSTS